MKPWLICLVLVGSLFGQSFAGEYASVSIKFDHGSYAPMRSPIGGGEFTVGPKTTLVKRYAEFPDHNRAHGRLQYSICVWPKVTPLCVVVAVDGTNVLTGDRIDCVYRKDGMGRGWVLREKRMYAFRGWRENLRTNRRFKVVDSWKSISYQVNGRLDQVGTIAVSVFSENRLPRSMPRKRIYGAGPGTGAGEREYRPLRVTKFDAEDRAREVFGIRYVTATDWRRWGNERQDDGFFGRLPETR